MRYSKVRFKKSEDGITMNFSIPSLTKEIFWVLVLMLVFPWLIIISKLELVGRIFSLFESIMNMNNEQEATKKNGLFY